MYKWNKIHCYFYPSQVQPCFYSQKILLQREEIERAIASERERENKQINSASLFDKVFLYEEIWFITENELLFQFRPRGSLAELTSFWTKTKRFLSSSILVTPGCCVVVKLSFPTFWPARAGGGTWDGCFHTRLRALVLWGRSDWETPRISCWKRYWNFIIDV